MFQFYDSPIKRKVQIGKFTMLETRFNSMIVRLKEVKMETEKIQINLFQFYDSPIKSPQYSINELCDMMFQFYDSPIKSNNNQYIYIYIYSFNSMIVRLKGADRNRRVDPDAVVSIL